MGGCFISKAGCDEVREMKNLIKLERARSNMTQADLAEKVKVSRQTINSIETNRFVPSTSLALRIASVLNCKVDELFQLEDSDWE